MRRLIALLFVFSLSLHTAVAQESAEKDPVRVCTHLGFEPFVIHEGKHLFGIDIDIIKSVFEDSHYNPSLVTMPWARLINSLKEGTCDIGFSLFDRDERRNFVDFIFDVPMHFSTYQVFVPKSYSIPFERIGDLYGKRIAHNRGFSLSADLENAIQRGKIDLVEYDDPQSALQMLLAGRIDAIIDNELRMKYYLKRYRMQSKINALDIPFVPYQPAFLAVSKRTSRNDTAELKELISERLIHLQRSGMLKKITENYIK